MYLVRLAWLRPLNICEAFAISASEVTTVWRYRNSIIIIIIIIIIIGSLTAHDYRVNCWPACLAACMNVLRRNARALRITSLVKHICGVFDLPKTRSSPHVLP